MSASTGPRRWRRRQILACLGGSLLIPAMAVLTKPTKRTERWISATGDSEENYGLSWVEPDVTGGNNRFTGFRGHEVLAHPRRPNSVISIARRPGTTVVEFDLSHGGGERQFNCLPGRHLFGHGCFSLDGSVLYTTEGNVAAGKGRVTVRDADSYVVLDDWPSHGVGPHDIHLLPDGKTLVVANGGILTRPSTGRKPLNLTTMRSSLSYIDATSGKLLGEYRLDEPKSSIRHLDVAADGSVAFAIQLQRKATGHDHIVSLAGIHRPNEQLTLLDSPPAIAESLLDYIGSVAICDESRLAGYTSPRGNLAVFWHVDNGKFMGYHRLRDVCGIAVNAQRNAFVLSNSLGELRELDALNLQERREKRMTLSGYRWDNHLLVSRAM